MTTITALPTAPSRADPANFRTRADAFMAALPTFATETNTVAGEVNTNASNAATSASTATTQAGIATTQASEAAASAAAALAAPGTSATSTTSLTVGTGTKSLTIQTGKSLVVGMPVVIARTSAPSTTRMNGTITSYDSGTGALDVSVVSTEGSGTHTDWTISLSGIAAAVASQAEMEAGTEAALRDMSPLRVKQAIVALGEAYPIGSVHIGPSAPSKGTWLKTGEVYLQASYATLYAQLGLLANTDTSTWTARTIASGYWTSVAYGNGVYVAVNSGGLKSTVAATSPDGVTWTTRTLPSDPYWRSVTYGNGLFVAVAYGSTAAATSPDGITWTARTMPSSATWYCVAYGNGVFVAAAYGSTAAATSPDGITWTARTMPTGVGAYAIAFGAGLFAVVTNTSTAGATTIDGITWTARTLPSAAPWSSIAYGNGTFAVVAENSTAVATCAAISYDTATQFYVPYIAPVIGLQQRMRAA